MVCLLVLLFFLSTKDDPAAHVEMVRGTASVQMNSVLTRGQTIRTGDDGYVSLRISNGERFEVFPHSIFVMRYNAWPNVLKRLRRRFSAARGRSDYAVPPVIAVRG
jgi:hypothetical protein